jgi:hypothetical protein
MARLPIPSGDNGAWGVILNDFLAVAHNADGTLKDTGIVAAKANDSSVVHNSGAETIAGIKTFSASPIVPTPTLGGQATTKAYVDSTVSAGAPDATTSSKGLVQLAGDLAGTAAAPTVPGLAAKATDSAVVHNTGNETVGGIKTFSLAPVVPNASFTLAKLADIATARILGRATAGSGSIEELTAAQTKTLLAITATDVANTPAGAIAATTVQAALNELDNEKMSATVVHTNGVNDTPTMQAAINIGGFVYAPDAHYTFLGGLTVPANAAYGLRLEGSAEGTTTFDFTALSSGVAIDMSTGVVRNVTMSNVSLLGPGIGSTVTAVKTYHAYVPRHVETINFGTGLDIGPLNGIYLDPSNEFRTCGVAVSITTSGNQQTLAPRVFSCVKGVVTTADGIHVTGAWFENCTGTEVECGAGRNVVVADCWIEHSRTTACVYVSSPTTYDNLTIRNNVIVTGASPAAAFRVNVLRNATIHGNTFGTAASGGVQVDGTLTVLRDWDNYDGGGTIRPLAISGAGSLTNKFRMNENGLTIGATSSTTGTIALPNAASVSWRNAANTADIALAVNASNQLTFPGRVIATGGSFQTDSGLSIIKSDAADTILRMQNTAQRWDVFGNSGDGQSWQVRDVTNSKTVLRCMPGGSTTVAAGASAAYAAVGGILFDHFSDVGNGTTVETDLYSDTIAASVLSTNGHKLQASYTGSFAANTTTKQLKVYFGGTVIFDSGALAVSATLTTWVVKVLVIRVSASVVRCSVDYQGAVSALPAYTEVTGLTLTNAQTLKITGTAGGGGANNDIIAKLATVTFNPAA